MKKLIILALFIAFSPLAFGSLTADEEVYVKTKKAQDDIQSQIQSLQDQKNAAVKQAGIDYENQLTTISQNFDAQIEAIKK